MANGWKNPDSRIELRQSILDLYRELFGPRPRQPELSDISTIVYILREMYRTGVLDWEPPSSEKGIIGQIAAQLGITPGMLWLTGVLCALLVGKPFFDFLKSVLPFFG